jgi:hypothetical protein
MLCFTRAFDIRIPFPRRRLLECRRFFPNDVAHIVVALNQLHRLKERKGCLGGEENKLRMVS